MKLGKLVKVAETLKGEGFAGYENDQDPETHVKIQSQDHARTGSAQQAQYDGTEGKSQSKEKPLKVLTDGELEEVEKLKSLALETKDALRAVEGQGKMKPQSGRKPDTGREKPDYFESQQPYGFGKLGRKEPQTSRGQADDATQSTVSPHGGYSAKDPRDGSTAIVQFPPREAGEDTLAGEKKLNQHKPVATGHASSGNSWRKEEEIPLSMYDHEPITEIKEEDYNKEGKYTHHKLRKVPRTGKPSEDLKHEPLGDAAENRRSDTGRMERAGMGLSQTDETYDQEEERRRGGKQPKTGKAPKDIKASKLGKIRKKAMELTKMRSDKWDDDERDEYRKYREGRKRKARRDPNDRKAAKPPKDFDEDQRGDDDHNEYMDSAGNFDREAWVKEGKRMQTEHQEHAGDKNLPEKYRIHAQGLDERIGEELGEVPRSRVMGEKHGKKTTSDQGKHIGLKMVEDEVKENPDVDADDLKDRAVTAAHALTYTDENAEKWKAFRKATDVIKRRRRGLPPRRRIPRVVKDATRSEGYENPPPEMLARPKKEQSGRWGKKIARQRGGDWHRQQLGAKRYTGTGGDDYRAEPHPRSQGSKRKWEALRPQSGEKYEGIVDHKGKPVLIGDKKVDQRGSHQGRNDRGRKKDPNEQKNTGQAGFAQASHRSATHNKNPDHGWISGQNRSERFTPKFPKQPYERKLVRELPDEEGLDRLIQAKEHGKIEGKKKRPPTVDLSELKRRAEILGQKSPQSNIRTTPRGSNETHGKGDKWMEHYANNRYKLMTPEELDKLTKALQILKEGTNAANGTSPRGGNYLGTNDTEAFNVRHNGGRKTNRYGKKPEDLGNFP